MQPSAAYRACEAAGTIRRVHEPAATGLPPGAGIFSLVKRGIISSRLATCQTAADDGGRACHILRDDALVGIQVGVMRHAVVLDRVLLHADAGQARVVEDW